MFCGRRLLAVAIGVCLIVLAAGAGWAQKTTSTETKSFEVISVDGNKVVLRGAEGAKEFTVPDDFRFDFNGKLLSVSELKPGMKGKATITTTTTTTPVTVTEVKKGVVKQVQGGSVIVQTDKGFQRFTQGDLDRRNVTILHDGKPVDLSELRAGEHLSATIVTAGPPQVLTEREVKADIASGGATVASVPHATAKAPEKLAHPSPAPAPPPSTSESTSASEPAAGEASAAKTDLPPTASSLPLVGLVGLAALAIGIALMAVRRHG